MTIASQIQDYADGLTASYNMVSQRGGTIPQRKNMQNLSTAIATIPSGGGQKVYIPRAVDANGGLIGDSSVNGTNWKLDDDIKDLKINNIASYILSDTSPTSVSLNNLETVSGNYAGQYMFGNCATGKITAPKLVSITGSYALQYLCGSYGNASLTEADFPVLTTISNERGMAYAFYSCNHLATVDFSSLSTLTGQRVFNYSFAYCYALKNISFPAITATSFGSYTNQFQNMLSGVTGCTLHFKPAAQTAVQGLSGYPNFGGTNTTVLFDL